MTASFYHCLAFLIFITFTVSPDAKSFSFAGTLIILLRPILVIVPSNSIK